MRGKIVHLRPSSENWDNFFYPDEVRRGLAARFMSYKTLVPEYYTVVWISQKPKPYLYLLSSKGHHRSMAVQYFANSAQWAILRHGR